MEKVLLTTREAADVLKTNVAQVKAWTRKAQHPLPSVVVGESGKYRKVVADVDPETEKPTLSSWLDEEAKLAAPRPRRARRSAA